jgi:hypothetical protein
MNDYEVRDGYVVHYNATVRVLVRPDGTAHVQVSPPYDGRDIDAVTDITLRWDYGTEDDADSIADNIARTLHCADLTWEAQS